MNNTNTLRKLSVVSSRFGAPMGRRNNIPYDISTASKLHLVALKFVDGDYDKGGAYWGYNAGTSIYWAYGETETEQIDCFIRAKNRKEAKELVRKEIKNAKFYR